MTVEELLKPRYKIIADFPFSPFKEQQILILDTYDDRPHLEAEWYGLINNTCYYESYLNRWPHLFKKLEWWEERKESDMPEYVKWKHLNQVFLLSDLNSVNQPHLLSVTLPATKEEYENQKTIE